MLSVLGGQLLIRPCSCDNVWNYAMLVGCSTQNGCAI